MPSTSNKVATAKKVARPPIKPANPDPDPVGLAQVLAEISTQLEEGYQEWLRAFLSKFLLVEFEPAELQRIIDAGTEWPPVTLPATLTIYPRDALGFVRVYGALETPPEEPQSAGPADDPEYVDYNTLFDGVVRKYRPKGGWRKGSRGRR
jgi:hypothetical protein